MKVEQVAADNVKKTIGNMAFEYIMRDSELMVARARIAELEARVAELEKPASKAE